MPFRPAITRAIGVYIQYTPPQERSLALGERAYMALFLARQVDNILSKITQHICEWVVSEPADWLSLSSV